MKEFWQVIKRYVPPYKGYLGGSIALNILSGVFNVFSFSLLIPILQILFNVGEATYEFIPWHQGMAFNEITNNVYWFVSQYVTEWGPARVLLALCLVFCAIVAVKTTCYFGAAAIMVPIRTGVVKDMRMEIYNKIVRLPLGFFSQKRKGDILARISGDVNEVENSITRSVIGRKLRATSIEAQQYWSDTISQVEETLGGLRIIKAFLAERKMTDRFDQVTTKMKNKNNQVATRQAMAHPVSEFLGSVMIAIVLWFGGTLILGDNAIIDAPSFMAYMAILYSVIQPIKDLSRAAYSIPRGLASMERIDMILNAEDNIKDKEDPVRLSGFNDRMQFHDVSFRYEDGREVLHHIDLEIPKGKNIAIVGASGAGKSTLVDLIPRFYDPTEGGITIDGTDLRDVSTRDLRALMGNVNQDPILFNDTIFNNIAFGIENATMEQVVEAAKIANAHEFIMEKEEGYQTKIGDRGVKLSGGQRQRISIARAILKNPPILILDEATASLDTASERLVQEALDNLMCNRTTISIAHRLSTVRNADEIIVMDEGRIVERGRHEELIALNGYYKRLYEMQAL